MALSRLVGAKPGWNFHEANYLEDNQPEIMSRAHQACLVLIPHIVLVFDRAIPYPMGGVQDRMHFLASCSDDGMGGNYRLLPPPQTGQL